MVTAADIPTHIEFESWEQLVETIVRGATSRVWRGQRMYDWSLTTSLSRKLKTADPGHSQNWIDLENSAIGFFMDRVGGFADNTPDEHDLLACLSLMQHYGAPTRLIDWSLSPFVAIYFAYEQPSDDDAALYALDFYLARRINVQVLFPKPWDYLGVQGITTADADGEATTQYPTRSLYRRERENDILRWAIQVRSKCPLPTIPLQQDTRMAAQQTILTLMGDLDIDVNEWLDKSGWDFPKAMPGGPVARTDSSIWRLGHPAQLLNKIRLPQKWRRQALQSLELMGITASSMFPGLDGIGRATAGHLTALKLTPRDVLTG
jgi:hypothetical protein